MKINLLTKLIIISILLGFLPYCLLNVVFLRFMTNASLKEIELATSYHVQSVSQALENIIVNFEEMTHWIIGNNKINHFLTLSRDATIEQYNSAYMHANSELYLLPFSAKPFASISIFRIDGRQLISGSLSHTPQQLTETEKCFAVEYNG